MVTTQETDEVTDEETKVGKPFKTAKDGGPLWALYAVELQFEDWLGASTPRTVKEIRAMLTNRMPSKMPDDATPVDELILQVAREVGIKVDDEGEVIDEGDAEEGWTPGWATYKREEQPGQDNLEAEKRKVWLYYEGRCIRAHLKDAATVLGQAAYKVSLPAFRSKYVNRVYVHEQRIPLWRRADVEGGLQRVDDVDGTETRFVQTMTPRGHRSSIKMIDFVMAPVLKFRLRVLNDGVIGKSHLDAVWAYGSTHGMGAERSQDWGRYTINRMERVR